MSRQSAIAIQPTQQGWYNQQWTHPVPKVITAQLKCQKQKKTERELVLILNSSFTKNNNKERVLDDASQKRQTFPVGAVGDLRGVDALGGLLVGGFLGDRWAFELALRGVQGF